MREILKQAGYPERILTLDLECYFDSEYSLKEMGAIEYVQGQQFELLAIGLKRDDSPAQCVIGDTYPVGIDWNQWTCLCHNAAFDLLVLDRRFGIMPPFVLDTLALARHWDSRSKHDLGSLCHRFKLPAKGETQDFNGWTFRERYFTSGRSKAQQQRPIFTPEKIEAMKGYCANDVEQTYALASILLPKLSNPATELKLAKHTLDLMLSPALKLDKTKAAELLLGMVAEIEKSVAESGYTAKEISANKIYEGLLVDALHVAGDDPRRYFKTTAKGTYKLADAKADPFADELLAHKDEGVCKLALARKAIKSWPLHMKRVERMTRIANCDGGWLGIPLNYHGAHTGRWSGGGKWNPQNFPKQGHPLIVAMRGLIVPPPGHKLVIVDAAQIEARVLAWAAGQDDKCQAFRDKRDVYCEFATKVLGFPVRKPRATDLVPIKNRFTWARNAVGKVGELGCGYGMGAAKTVGYAQGAIDFAMAERVVQTYRKENPKIVDYWYRVERAFSAVAKGLPPVNLGRGVIVHSAPDCDVCITLPNGRKLYYQRVRSTSEGLEIFSEMTSTWERTWGGSLVENIVQAISRDILAEAMLRLEEIGYHTALHAHDELVLVEESQYAQNCLNHAIDYMGRAPTWAKDCPLAAEGFITDRYGKG